MYSFKAFLHQLIQIIIILWKKKGHFSDPVEGILTFLLQ